MKKSLYLAFFIPFLLPQNTHAQITPDNTLGDENSVVTPLDSQGSPVDLINGGATRGANLFHSFQEFNVDAGRGAYFNNPTGIENIFSRVTGGNVSNINGVLGVLGGNANLFLINPNGIIFGENARLDLGGSFFGSSADSLVFENNFEFSASNPTAPPLLTINVPIGINFREQTGDITVRGNGQGIRFTSEPIDTVDALRVDANQTLGLVGGNLNFEGATIKTAGGRIELGSIQNGTVNLVEIANGFAFDYSEVENFSDIQLNRQSAVDASGLNGGEIQVQGQNITLTDNSIIEASNLGSENQGNLDITASESISLNNGSDIFGLVYSNQTGAAGIGSSININTPNLTVSNGSIISSSTFGVGNAGNLEINANSVAVSNEIISNDGTITAFGATGIFSIVGSNAEGNGGQINLSTNELNISGSSSFISTTTFGQGNAGNISINTTNLTDVNDNAAIWAIVESSGVGNAGEININTNQLNLDSGASISVSTLGNGNGNVLNIDASESININNGARLLATTLGSGTGNGGQVNISTADLSLTNDALIRTSTFREGNSGLISINASDSISLDNSRILNRVRENGVGNSGGIKITTSNLFLDNGSQINTSTLASGNGGLISIDANDTISLNNSSGIASQVDTEAIGKGGDIEINANNLNLSNRSIIGSSGFGQGDTGTVSININENFSLDNSAVQNAISENAIGNAKEVEITTTNLSLTNSSSINTNLEGEGSAGSITIDAQDSVYLDGVAPDGLTVTGIFSAITSTGNGTGGNIEINTVNFSVTDGAVINTNTSGKGNAGNIIVNASESVFLDGNAPIPDGFSESGIFTSVELGEGDGGQIEIVTKELSINNSARIDTSTRGNGNAGSIFIDASESISLDEVTTNSERPSSFIVSSAFSETSKAGQIDLITSNLFIGDKAGITTNLFGQGDAGNITINAAESIRIQGGIESVNSEGVGNAGTIEINTRNLEITNAGSINTSTLGQGNAGSILINADESVAIDGISSDGSNSSIGSQVLENAEGNAGSIEINTRNFSITNGGRVVSNTLGNGDAGTIFINASDSILFKNDAGIASAVIESGIGDAGNIEITSNNLSLEDFGFIAVSTFGRGNAGEIFIEVNDSISLKNEGQIVANTSGQGNGGDIFINAKNISIQDELNILTGILSNVSRTAEGNSGDINITTEKLSMIGNSAEISASTQGQGNAGDLNITATDSVNIVNGSGIFADAFDVNAIGNSGDLTIETQNLSINNRGRISVNNISQGNAGTLTITADFISLQNNSSIAGEITNGEGGNIELNVTGILQMRNDSSISAQAFNNSNGGNVTINADDGFVIAFPNQNNDIFANASQGNGGKITITTQAIFGLEEKKSTPPNTTNDIDASSDFGLQGDFSLNTPDVDPTTGLLELPASVGDISDTISQNPCEQTVGSEFIVTGKGGFPANPHDNLTVDGAEVDLVEPIQQLSVNSNQLSVNTQQSTLTTSSSPHPSSFIPHPSTNPLIPEEAPPARGWILNEQGLVVLTAYDPTKEGVQRTPQSVTGCSVSHWLLVISH